MGAATMSVVSVRVSRLDEERTDVEVNISRSQKVLASDELVRAVRLGELDLVRKFFALGTPARLRFQDLANDSLKERRGEILKEREDGHNGSRHRDLRGKDSGVGAEVDERKDDFLVEGVARVEVFFHAGKVECNDIL